MSTQKQKFELFSRLQAIGFTYDEAATLRRIEMTLHRWAELECGDDCGRAIERDDETGKPYMTHDAGHNGHRVRYAVSDREAGALRRLKAIIDARNERTHRPVTPVIIDNALDWVIPYHQTDPRGCALYLVRRGDLINADDAEMTRHSGAQILRDEASRLAWRLEQSYSTRGLAVCAQPLTIRHNAHRHTITRHLFHP